ncbi:glycerol kinase GlpK [Brevibacillus daliensis]|uniref:glycerol kinase GlpK n=1 Tax=Brevibacillus daliensis TaxID=2892995 RepID=UPI001E35C1C5|nr:glycerol kinase GlpK [Brevibacillus daliensis]
MGKQYIVALDQGTTSCRAILFDHKGKVVQIAQREFQQFYPKPGWVEHDANEIWKTQLAVMQEAIGHVQPESIAAIGITNQRETTVLWDKNTGEPVHPAIVWQCRRTSELCEEWKDGKTEQMIKAKTGLVLDPYFSGTKIKWILDQYPEIRKQAEEGTILFGTIDSWLIWKLTEGGVHVTDPSNASRTLLYNIYEQKWDEQLLTLMGIPRQMLPDVRSSSEIYGYTNYGSDEKAYTIPIAGVAGDQQAALFGQNCLEKGMAKNTYGTGCFLLLHTGEKAITSDKGLLTTIAWKIGDKVEYALEGSVFIAGAAVQWLRDGVGIIKNASEIEELANSVEDTEGVHFVPAFTGLGAPYWNVEARGMICGLTRGTTKAHLARAALEAIAFQSKDVLECMVEEAGITIKELRVDGGASRNNLLMQFQSDILDVSVIRPVNQETTALGAAFLAGLAVGFWRDTDEIASFWEKDRIFYPNMEWAVREEKYAAWKHAVAYQMNLHQ